MKAEKFPSTTEADDRKQTQTGADRLSVVILTYNEQANVPACLESLKGLDCEILLVDSGSTDATIEIARRAGATVFTHPFENYAAQRNWAQKNLPFHTNWVLHLDADERLTPALVKEITRVLKAPPDAINGFLLRKRTIFMGRWIRHGGPVRRACPSSEMPRLFDGRMYRFASTASFADLLKVSSRSLLPRQ